MTYSNELLMQLASKGEQALEGFAELWKNRHSPLDQQINKVLSTQSQHSEQLTALLKQQAQMAEQLTQEMYLAHPERAFLDDASAAAARIWLRNPNNKPVIEELQHQALSKAERTAIFGNEGLFTALNYRSAQMLTTTQVLTLIKTPKLREKFAQADFITLFAQADFIKLFAQADFIKLFEQPLFIKVLTPQALLKHFADPAFTRAFNPTQQLAAFQHTQLQELFNQAEFIKLFNQAEFIKLFNQADFASFLAKPEVLNKITTARSRNAAQFAHWPKLASTAKPVLGYFYTQYNDRVQTQRNAISKRYALALDTSSQSQIQTAVQQAQINTLIHPIAGPLTAKPLYRDFVALGGRLIVNLWSRITEQFLNHSFGWALDHTNQYGSGFHFQATELTTATLVVKKGYVNFVSHTSLPAGAKVFLAWAGNPNHIAGFYIRYGLGEVMGISYDWESGSDSAWDALLHGLIQGTALTYQRRYG